MSICSIIKIFKANNILTLARRNQAYLYIHHLKALSVSPLPTQRSLADTSHLLPWLPAASPYLRASSDHTRIEKHRLEVQKSECSWRSLTTKVGWWITSSWFRMTFRVRFLLISKGRTDLFSLLCLISSLSHSASWGHLPKKLLVVKSLSQHVLRE